MSLLRFLVSGAGAAATQTIGVTNTNLFFSPYNTYSDGAGAMLASNVKDSSSYALLVTTGAYLKFKVTVASGAPGNVSLTLDTTAYNGLTASTCPTLSYTYDDRPYTTVLLAYSASVVTQTVASGMAAGTHTITVRFKSVGGTALGSTADRWTTPAYAVKVTGILIDATASIPSQTLRANRAMFFGDSNPEGDNALLANNDSANDILNASNDAFRAWPTWVAEALDCEYGTANYGGQGWTLKGIGNATVDADHPALYHGTDANQSWNKYFKSTARTITSPETPDYIFIMNGVNDGGTLTSTPITSLLTDLRTAVGGAPWIFVCEHGIGNANETTIATGVTNAADSKAIYLTCPDMITAGTPSEYSGDAAFSGSHPNHIMHARLAAFFLEGAVDAIESGATSGGGIPIIGGAIVRAVA